MVLCPLTVPPEITAQCLDRSIIFSLVKPPGAKGIWELGVDHEPLTPELAAQRGYLLYDDTERTSLEVPVLSIGYQYEVRFNWGDLKRYWCPKSRVQSELREC